jgi:hypothetical protein
VRGDDEGSITVVGEIQNRDILCFFFFLFFSSYCKALRINLVSEAICRADSQLPALWRCFGYFRPVWLVTGAEQHVKQIRGTRKC